MRGKWQQCWWPTPSSSFQPSPDISPFLKSPITISSANFVTVFWQMCKSPASKNSTQRSVNWNCFSRTTKTRSSSPSTRREWWTSSTLRDKAITTQLRLLRYLTIKMSNSTSRLWIMGPSIFGLVILKRQFLTLILDTSSTLHPSESSISWWSFLWFHDRITFWFVRSPWKKS